MHLLIWLLIFITVETISITAENGVELPDHSIEAETIYFELPEKIKLECGLHIKLDCDNLCRDSILIEKNSMLMAELSVTDMAENCSRFFEPIACTNKSVENARHDITSACLKFLQERLGLPEMEISEDGHYEFIYEVKIFQPRMVQEGEQIVLAPGEISRNISYTLSFTQEEYDSLRNCEI